MYKTRFKFVERMKANVSKRKPKQKPVGYNQSPDLLRIKKCFDKNILLKGKIIDRIKGGYKILIGNYEVFCPVSHMSPIFSDRHFKEKNQFKFLQFKVMSDVNYFVRSASIILAGFFHIDN
jgi:ribosomal protein S1